MPPPPPPPPLSQRLAPLRRAAPVSSKAVNYPSGYVTVRHHHTVAQLIYAESGVMVVSSDAGQWTVPPTRGIWMPTMTDHVVRMVGDVAMRTLYVHAKVAEHLPQDCRAVAISDLLKQLILRAMDVTEAYVPNSHHGRLMGLILDELTFLPVLPLHLPRPSHPLLQTICTHLNAQPDSKKTLVAWAAEFGVDPKTLQRLFAQQTSMRFGQWRQQARLLLALEQLAAGERILDVALGLGYDSPSAFAAMFKKHLGTVPSEYFVSVTPPLSPPV